MITRRAVLRSTLLVAGLAAAAFGGWAVRPYLSGTTRPAAAAGASSPTTTEDLIARLEQLRNRKRELDQHEREVRERLRAQRNDIEQEERDVLAEIQKLKRENEQRLSNLGHRTDPAIHVSAR